MNDNDTIMNVNKLSSSDGTKKPMHKKTKELTQWDYLEIVNHSKSRIDELEKQYKDSHPNEEVVGAPDTDDVLYELSE